MVQNCEGLLEAPPEGKSYGKPEGYYSFILRDSFLVVGQDTLTSNKGGAFGIG
jgi:hypothetical protein